jgi:hypothetical protein
MRDLYEARMKHKRDVAQLVYSGKEEGKLISKKETLIRLIDKKFGISEDIEKIILSCNGPAILDKALDAFVFASDLDEILEVFRK